jgi:hypothetical protein
MLLSEPADRLTTEMLSQSGARWRDRGTEVDRGKAVLRSAAARDVSKRTKLWRADVGGHHFIGAFWSPTPVNGSTPKPIVARIQDLSTAQLIEIPLPVQAHSIN